MNGITLNGMGEEASLALGPANGPFRLRSFPVPVQFGQKNSLGGGSNGETNVEWAQSQGQLTLTYRIEGQLPERRPWSEDDVKVELSAKSLKVTLNGEPFKAMTGDFLNTIWRFKSWWAVEDETLIVHLFKREFGSWRHPFHGQTQGLFKRQAFPWTKQMTEMGSGHNVAGHGNPNLKDVPQEEELEEKAPGRPSVEAGELLPDGSVQPTLPGGAFAPISEQYLCAADDLCLGITAEQADHVVTVEVHFELERFEQLKARYPLEALLAVDVWDKAVSIFFQGDKSNPILWAELDGHVEARASTWRISSSDYMRSRQISAQKYSPCLQVKLTKTPGAPQNAWKKVFSQCWQHKLMVKEIGPYGPERFQGIEGGKTFLRSGYNLDDPDFWGNVDNYVSQTMRQTGYTSAPKKLVV